MKSHWVRISILALAIAGSVNATPPENDTHLRTQTFVMELPGMWQRLPSNEAIVYGRDADTILISSIENRTKLQWNGGKVTEPWLVDLRRQALEETAQGSITFTPRRGTMEDGREMYYFSAVDSLNKKRLYVAVVGLPETLVSMTLSRPIAEPSAGFEERFNRIMWSIRSPSY